MNTASGIWRDAMSALDFFLALIERAPLGTGSVVFGIIIALCVGQWAKRWIPKVMPIQFDMTLAENVHRAKVHSDRREFLIESTSFLGGLIGTYATYPSRQGVLLGILVGFIAPNVWTGLSVLLRPFWAWWLRKWKPVGEV